MRKDGGLTDRDRQTAERILAVMVATGMIMRAVSLAVMLKRPEDADKSELRHAYDTLHEAVESVMTYCDREHPDRDRVIAVVRYIQTRLARVNNPEVN